MTLSVLGSHTAVGYMARPAEMLGASGPHVAPADVLARMHTCGPIQAA